jgi:ubiquinone/menaquinone biosynthesis C-methylase UbiE
MKYDKTNIPKTYNVARAIPKKTMELWLNALSKFIPKDEVYSIIDVGCGTGRFSAELSKFFNADVIGFDPSKKMLEVANSYNRNPRVSFYEGSAEILSQPDQSSNLAFLSMVFHHIEKHDIAIKNINKVLKSNGFFCIRNSTKDLVNQYPYLDFFPSAKEFNIKRLHSQSEIITMVELHGFMLVSHEVLKQQFAVNMREYFQKVSQRGLSDLAYISDNDFNKGISLMQKRVNQKKEDDPIFEPIDLFIFKKVEQID